VGYPIRSRGDVSTGKARLRVLRVITRLNVGGPARQALYLNRVLPERGIASELIRGLVDPSEGELSPPIETKNICVPALRKTVNPVRDAAAYRAVAGHIRRTRPDIVHTHMAKAGTIGRIAARRNDTPVVIHTFHGHVLEGYFSPARNQVYLRIERLLARSTDVLVAVSPAVRDELLSLGIGRPSQWRVIPLGLELQELLDARISPLEARRRLGLPEDGPLVGIVGRLVPIKDHATFLRAAAAVSRSRPDAHFVIAGGGELSERLEAEASDLLPGRCHFVGWVLDLPSLYAALDVVVLTSRNEGTPVALIEAAAAGKPAVATDVGGVSDVVRDGVTGFLVRVGDPGATAERIVTLLESRDRGAAMGRGAREWVRERFSAERLATDIEELYREQVARKRPPGGHQLRGA
jgi:glycosyltransferase involved in cell wall biosynthesis